GNVFVEPEGIQAGPRGEGSCPVKPDCPSYILAYHIRRVGDADKKSVKAALLNAGDDILYHADRVVQHVQPCLSRTAAAPRGHDHDIRVRRIHIVPRIDLYRVSKPCGRVADILGLSLRLGPVYINKDYLVRLPC